MASDGDSFPKMTRPGLYTLFVLLLLTLISPLFLGRAMNALVSISQSTMKGGNLFVLSDNRSFNHSKKVMAP